MTILGICEKLLTPSLYLPVRRPEARGDQMVVPYWYLTQSTPISIQGETRGRKGKALRQTPAFHDSNLLTSCKEARTRPRNADGGKLDDVSDIAPLREWCWTHTVVLWLLCDRSNQVVLLSQLRSLSDLGCRPLGSTPVVSLSERVRRISSQRCWTGLRG